MMELTQKSVQRLCKVIFVGSSGVGKTCLLNRLFSDHFDSQSSPTIGSDFHFKSYEVDGKRIGVTLWDTAGSEKFSALSSSYFKAAHGIILVYDCTRRETLEALESHWLKEVEAHSTLKAMKLVVGNKTDLVNERQVSPEEGAAFARSHCCMYQEASAAAQNDTAHDALVWGLIANIAADDKLLKSSNQDRLQLERRNPEKQQRRGCC